MSMSTDVRDRPIRARHLGGAVLDLRHDVAPPIDLRDRPPARREPIAAPSTAPVIDPIADHVVTVDAGDLVGATGLAGRWLSAAELAAADQRGERGRAAHIAGRVAAKQAVIAHLEARGFATIAPHRIEITNDDRGCPAVVVRGARIAARHLRISIGHAGAIAVALASARRADPHDHDGDGIDAPDRRLATPGIGVDIEAVEARSDRFERLTLTPAERLLDPVPGDDRDTWLTRLWSAKEVAAKATGHGLRGRPKAFEASRVDGERLRVDGRWITTELVTLAGRTHVVAATADHRTECAWHRS
jgi:phosphopantetheinyl transferase (holo-ACP synthase)